MQLTMSNAPRQQLPPASLQTFVKERNDFSGVVITSHEKAFVNRSVLYYFFCVVV